MQLTLHTDYSFRVLIYLYVNSDSPATVGEISDYYGVSHNHLVKVVNNLGHLGMVETVRGKGGGVRLLPHVADLSAGTILRELEGATPLVNCQGGGKSPKCAVLPICRFNRVLNSALDKFYQELDGYKLPDLVTQDIASGLPGQESGRSQTG